jgi:hypothetical protein
MKKIALVTMFMAFVTIATSALAKEINLYKDANLQSEKMGLIDSSKGIISIIEKGDWVKVASPVDGKTGWIMAKELPKFNNDASSVAQHKVIKQSIITKDGTKI